MAREMDPRTLRINKPRVGPTPLSEDECVHEYGRLINLHYFEQIGDSELQGRRAELGIDTSEKLRKAENVSVIYRYLELQNRRDYEGIEKLHTDPYINKTYFGHHPISPKAHTRTLRGYFKVYPDATTEANKIIAAEGNTVVVRTTARGTQERELPGSLLGGPTTQIAVTLIHAIEVQEGRIAACESTNPFENQWTADIVNSSFPGLGQDVSDARARQGIDTDYELLLIRLVEATRSGNMEIERLLDSGPNQCQCLIPPIMRRCAKLAESKSLYCTYHQEHGWGID